MKNLDYKIIHISNKEIRRKFLSYSPLFRIEAVIHDGQFYNIRKWAKVAKVSEKEIENYIKENENILIEQNCSYRVNTEEIIKWYKKHNLKIEEPIVPKNFVPKIWGGKSEADILEEFSRKRISSLVVFSKNPLILEKLVQVLSVYGKVFYGETDKLYVYTTCASFVKKILYQNLTNKEIEQIDSSRLRNSFKTREVSLMPDSFLTPFVEFYINYSLGILKPHFRTIDIFYPEHDDKRCLIQDWIISALQKYNEKSGVPFSGYLFQVLNRWPYDLPDIVLGKELSKFIRVKSRIIKKGEMHNISYTDKEISEIMNLPFEDYKRLTAEYETWLNFKRVDSHRWKDGKYRDIPNKINKTAKKNYKLAYKVSYSIIEATIETGEYDTFFEIIEGFNENSFLNLHASNEFKDNMKKSLVEIDRIFN